METETIVTADQRMTEIANRETFKKQREAAEQRLATELQRSLSVAERLMRRKELARFKTVFQDDLGDFAVETRQLTSSERNKAIQLNDQLAKSDKDPQMYVDAVKGYRQLAKEITLTPGMDEYYDSDQVTDDVLIAIVSRTFQGTMRFVGEAITSFRAE